MTMRNLRTAPNAALPAPQRGRRRISWQTRLAALGIVSLLTLACDRGAELEEFVSDDYRSERLRSICFSHDEDLLTTFTVDFDVCVQEGCSRVVDASCELEVRPDGSQSANGGDVGIKGSIQVHQAENPKRCEAPCAEVTATCSAQLWEGDWSFYGRADGEGVNHWPQLRLGSKYYDCLFVYDYGGWS